MNKYQNSYLNMMGAVLEVIDKTPQVWNRNAPLKNKIGWLRNVQTKIYNAAGKQKNYESQGYTITKEKECDQLRKILELVAARARSYAVDSANHLLIAKLKFRIGQIRQMSIRRLVVVSQHILDNIEPELPNLASYEIDASLLASLQESIDLISRSYSLRDKAFAEKMEATAQIKDLIKDAGNGLLELDNMIIAFSNNPEFTSTYFYARRILHSRGRAKVKKEDVLVREVFPTMANVV